MYNRLNNYLDANKIIVDNQYGFHKEHSTYMALLKMINDITNELQNKNYSLGLFIDLFKVFDTVDHKILIKKMYHYGIREIVLDWFTNYLCNQKQYVSINNVNSNMLPVHVEFLRASYQVLWYSFFLLTTLLAYQNQLN